MKLIRDTWLIFVRSLMLTLRNPVWVFIGLMQPVLYLVLFAPLLNPIASAPGFPPGGAFNVFVPGLLVQLAMFAAFTGFGLIAELRAGVIERMRVTPISRVAMLLGRALRDVVILLVQAVLIILFALPFGLSIEPGGFIVALFLLALLGLIMTPFSYTRRARGEERGRAGAVAQRRRAAGPPPLRHPPADDASRRAGCNGSRRSIRSATPSAPCAPSSSARCSAGRSPSASA